MPASQPHDSRALNYSEDIVVASAARTASGNSGILPGYGASKSLRAALLTSAASGTTPTLDVTLEDTLDGTNFFTIGTFTQQTTTGNLAVNVTTPFSDRIRVKWVVGGTTPSFTFSVIIASEVDPT